MGKSEDKYDTKYMVKRIDEYTDETEIPILKELCAIEHWNYNYVFGKMKNVKVIQEAVDRLLTKKEAKLERCGLEGITNTRMTELSLNQLGWSSKQEINLTSSDDFLQNVSIDVLLGKLEETEEPNEEK